MGFIIYLLLLVGTACLAILYLEFSSMQIFLIVLLLFIFMAAVLFVLRKSIMISVESKNPVYEMKSLREPAQVIIQLKVKNVSKLLPLSRGVVLLYYHNQLSGEKGKKKLYFCVDANQRIKKEHHITIRHCGAIHVKVKKIKVYDYLGIFSCKIKNTKVMESVVVLPPLEEIFVAENLLFQEGLDGGEHYSPYKKGDDASEIFAIRDFKEGDKLQQIHWKLSMKKNELMVKEYSMPLAKEISVFVDFYIKKGKRHPLREVDLLIQGVYSYTMNLMSKGLPVQLIWYDNVSGMMKRMTVSCEEELMWAFCEMFQTKITHNEEELITAYVEWGKGKPMENALYMTVGDGFKVSGESLSVKNLQIIRLHKKKGESTL